MKPYVVICVVGGKPLTVEAWSSKKAALAAKRDDDADRCCDGHIVRPLEMTLTTAVEKHDAQ